MLLDYLPLLEDDEDLAPGQSVILVFPPERPRTVHTASTVRLTLRTKATPLAASGGRSTASLRLKTKARITQPGWVSIWTDEDRARDEKDLEVLLLLLPFMWEDEHA